jgi:sodium/potassium/calcium exchanger 6
LTGYDLPTSSSNMSSAALQRFKPVIGARHSLLGAVEFRDVVRSLQQEALVDRSAEIFQSRDPERYLPHQHHHQHATLEVPPQRPQRSASQRGHARGRSLMTFHDVVPSGIRSGSISGADQGKPAIARSATTTRLGASSSELNVGPADQSWSAIKRTQPSSFDATAVAAAVGDPWKEHSASDGCEQVHDPSSSTALGDEESRDAERPRLRIETALEGGSNSSDQAIPADAADLRESNGRLGQGRGSEGFIVDWIDTLSIAGTHS